MEAPHCSIAPRANDKDKSANAVDHNLTLFFKDILIALPYLVHYFFYFGPRPIIA